MGREAVPGRSPQTKKFRNMASLMSVVHVINSSNSDRNQAIVSCWINIETCPNGFPYTEWLKYSSTSQRKSPQSRIAQLFSIHWNHKKASSSGWNDTMVRRESGYNRWRVKNLLICKFNLRILTCQNGEH